MDEQSEDDEDDDIYRRPPQYSRDSDLGMGIQPRERGQRTKRGGHGQREHKFEMNRNEYDDRRDADAKNQGG